MLEFDDIVEYELVGVFVLKFDNVDFVYSIFWSNGKVWLGGCYDVFVLLFLLLFEGFVVILGFGVGMVVCFFFYIWLFLYLEGWEFDFEVICVVC